MAGLVRAADWLPRWDEAPHRAGALRHAATHGRPGLWLDDPARPSSLAWLREGDEGRWEAFGAGAPGPALDRLAGAAGGRPIALLAPASWEAPARARGGRVDRAEVLTWFRPGSMPPPGPAGARRLGPGDRGAFEALAPPWALRGWGDYATMIGRGAGFGVPSGGGLAAIAWTYESDPETDKLGVATAAPFRRLGLGRSAASSLIAHVLLDRRKQPLWTTHAGNPASMALARSLGFSVVVAEPLLLWTPTMPTYPIELDLAGRTALVVGLGAVGRRKAAGLVAARARVVAVDPAGGSMAGVEVVAEAYRADHLAGASLAFAAAPAEVNRRVVADARARGVWVSSASDPGSGDFALPATWRDGPLTLTVSTSGASPALASALRDRAARALGPAAGGLVRLLAELRPEVLARVADPEARRRALAEVADPRWLALYEAEGPEAARRALRAALGLGPAG